MSTNTPADDDNELMIICQPYRMFSDKVIPGSKVIRAGCNHLAWISPQGQLFVHEHPDTKIACLQCKPKNVVANYRVPGAREAALAAFGEGVDVEHYDRTLSRLNLKEWPE